MAFPEADKVTVQYGQVFLVFLSQWAAGYLVSCVAFGLRSCHIQQSFFPHRLISPVSPPSRRFNRYNNFEAGSYDVAQAGLKLSLSLPQPAVYTGSPGQEGLLETQHEPSWAAKGTLGTSPQEGQGP